MISAITVDDLAGANDSTASFATSVLKTCAAFLDYWRFFPIALSLTRTHSCGMGLARTAKAVKSEGVSKAKPEILFEKIDSTKRGSIGDEIEVRLTC